MLRMTPKKSTVRATLADIDDMARVRPANCTILAAVALADDRELVLPASAAFTVTAALDLVTDDVSAERSALSENEALPEEDAVVLADSDTLPDRADFNDELEEDFPVIEVRNATTDFKDDTDFSALCNTAVSDRGAADLEADLVTPATGALPANTRTMDALDDVFPASAIDVTGV